MNTPSPIKLCCAVSAALLAFAGNSVLGRLALQNEAIDPASFTNIRLCSGALTLYLILSVSNKPSKAQSKGSWHAAFMLFLYAATFSFAYRTLEAGTGALILFGAVQLTTIITSLIKGNKLSPSVWAGVSIAFLGFFYLMSPNLATPSLIGFILMIIAGIAWANYTLLGAKSLNPLNDTAHNFLRTVPFVIPFALVNIPFTQLNLSGVLLAIASGAITSGLGYAIWYAALRHLQAISAVVLQLLVPVLATIGGMIFANETLTLHFTLSSFIILSGASLVIWSTKKPVSI